MNKNSLTILLTFLIVFDANCANIIFFGSSIKQDPSISNNWDKKVIDSIPFENYLVAYANKIPILNSPSLNADTIGFLMDLEVIERYLSYYSTNGVSIEANYQNIDYYPVKYQDDTAWIEIQDDISIKYEIDTNNNLIFRNIYKQGDFWCDVCYQKSIIYNLKTSSNWTISTSLEKSFELNDSLFLFSFYDSIKIYNINNNSFLYSVIGGVVIQEPEMNRIYYLSWSTGKYNKDSPCKLVRYNYSNDNEKTLFLENDLTKRPYYWGPNFQYFTDLKIKDSISNKYLTFTLFQMREDAEDEGDFVEFKKVVSTSGNVLNE